MKNQLRAYFVVFALVAIFGNAAFSFRNERSAIPQFDEAHFIHVGGKDSGVVEIHPADLGQLREMLETAKRDRSPMKWTVSGTLVLKKRGADVASLQFFSNQKGQGPFELRGVYYLGYDQESFREILARSKRIDMPR